MALSNRIELPAISGSGIDTNTKFILYWELVSQNSLSTNSKLSWELFLETNKEAPRAASIDFTYEIYLKNSAGETIDIFGYASSDSVSFEYTEDATIEKEINGIYNLSISHNEDGIFDWTLHVNITSQKFNYYKNLESSATTAGTNSVWQYVSDIVVPDVPPRVSVVITKTNKQSYTEDDSSMKIYYQTTHATDETTIEKVEACISTTGAVDDVPYRQVSMNTNYDSREATYTYTFNLTQEERQALYPAATDGPTGTIRFYIRTTFKDGTRTWAFLDRAYTLLRDYEPILSPTIEDVNPATLALTGGGNRLIRYASNVYYNTGAQARKGASIGTQRVKNGSYNKEIESTGIIEGVDSPIFEFYLADSRGVNAEPVSLTREMWDYVKLTCNQSVALTLVNESSAKANLTITGNYYNGSFGATNNELTLQVRHTQNDGTMSDWITLTDGLFPEFDGHTYSISITVSGLDSKSAYDFQCRAIDKLSSAETSMYTSRLSAVFDWGENDFNFNVPVKFNSTVEFADGSTGGGTVEPADYVIEIGEEAMGSNGTWYWRKWNSGKAEAWGCRNFGNMAITTAWGSLYRGAILTQDLPEDVFIRTPDAININIVHSNFGGWICKHEQTAPSADTTGSFIFVRPASATVSPTNIGFYVVGEWQ